MQQDGMLKIVQLNCLSEYYGNPEAWCIDWYDARKAAPRN